MSFLANPVSIRIFRSGKNSILTYKHFSGFRNTASANWRLGDSPTEHPPNTLTALSHHTDADELNVGVIRTKGVGGCACEEGIILGCRHIGNCQETAMDSTLVVCVLRVPGEELWQELREGNWG